MTARTSRTYRLRLSREGTGLFIGCHARLARLAESFVPYGATLFVAVLVTDDLETSDIAAELALPAVKRLAGELEHFVGASVRLSDVVGRIADRLQQSGLLEGRLQVGRLYIVGMMVMAASEDWTLVKAYRRMEALLEQG